MASVNAEIDNLKYKIGRLNLEINNLVKTIEKKKKNRILDEKGERLLSGEISEKQALIREMEAEIRKIEVTEIRRQNFQ